MKKNMSRYVLTISYDGTDFFGWQKQVIHSSIQGCLENVLSKIFKKNIVVYGASRTDSGVHAFGQCCMFEAPSLPLEVMKKIVQSKLPHSIYIRDVSYAINEIFHPRFSAVGKTYIYAFSDQYLLPHQARFVYFYPYHFDEALFFEALYIFVGTHDFRSFATINGEEEKDTIRTIYNITIKKENNVWLVFITGDGFLRYMIRRLVGAALTVATKKLTVLFLKDIMNKKNPQNSLFTLPSNGLLLHSIYYDALAINMIDVMSIKHPFL